MKSIIYINSNKSEPSRKAIKAAKEMGYFTIAFTNNERQLMQGNHYTDVQEMIYIDTNNIQVMKDEIKKLRGKGFDIKIIISFVDSHIRIAPMHDDEFFLNQISSPTVKPLAIKEETRTLLNKHQQAIKMKADELINIAKSLIGKATYCTDEYKPTAPYKFSCATFLMYIFGKARVDIATYNENYMLQQGIPVARNQLQKGDLLFFNSRGDSVPNHCAMYIGDNKAIHMADPYQHIIISDLDSKPYYKDCYITARRVLPSLLPVNPATIGNQIVSKYYDTMKKVTMGLENNEASLEFTGPGYVNYIYKLNGVHLGSTRVTELMEKGVTVSKNNLNIGDLVFFSSSKRSKTPRIVAIYAGEHRLIVPYSQGIRMRVIMADYYKDRYIIAKRVFTESSSPIVTVPMQTNKKADQIVNTVSNLREKVTFGYAYDEKTLKFTGAGFTYYVYQNHGIDLKYKLASRQALVGKTVSKIDLQKGDIIFFMNNKGTRITQTGIYIGDHRFTSLSTTDEVVQQSLNTAWAKANYVTAKRVL